ncbi:hypothetical protein L596_028379 [Steinernema carpocapsae]|uniref:Uncharacterized protein n=1 Tax=Steinernema carpocapsae TaxID=34508 RepID=A0A4U5LY86_STECR|nr:hypothetical protein L596_028379 [Steinernema carpocapsae]
MAWPILVLSAKNRSSITMTACTLHFLAFTFGLVTFGYNALTFFGSRYGLAHLLGMAALTVIKIYPYLQAVSGFWAFATAPLQAIAVWYHLDQKHRKTRWDPRSIKSFQVALYAAFFVTILGLMFNIAYWYYFQKTLTYGIMYAMSNYTGPTFNKDQKESLDWIQMNYECCGINGPTDYWIKKGDNYTWGADDNTYGVKGSYRSKLIPTCSAINATQGQRESERLLHSLFLLLSREARLLWMGRYLRQSASHYRRYRSK